MPNPPNQKPNPVTPMGTADAGALVSGGATPGAVETPGPGLHNYHLILKEPDPDSGETQRDLAAAKARLDGAALVLVDVNGDLSCAYAPGEWVMVEAGRKDDKS